MPKVSVVIPVYNVEKYLRECLDSVINQTLKDIEIICVDDGSTDSSLEILKEYAAKDSRIKIITQQNQHAGVARNNGLEAATGEFVHFLDSDDWIELDAYEKLYEILKNTGADLVKFKGYSFDNQTKEVSTRAYLDIAKVDEHYFNNFLNIIKDTENIIKLPDSPWSGVYNTDFLKKNNIYFDDFICVNDVGFFYRCIINAKKVYLSPEKLVYYRENMNNSLVARRARHFDCQTALYDVVKNASKNLPPETKNILINKIILLTLNWYKKCLKTYNPTKQDKKIIKQEMQKFLKRIEKDKITETTKQKCEKLKTKLKKEKYKKLKNFAENVFSIKDGKRHKILCFLGIKLKIKNEKLEYKIKV